MLVTQLVEISKSRVKVFIDYEFAFVLYKGELHVYDIHEGKELNKEDYEEIINVLLPKRAKLRCLNLLKNRDYTKFQLYQKLKIGGYPESVITNAILYTEDYGYIDDNKYAYNYICCYAQRKSRQKIEMELIKKGIEKNFIIKAWNKYEEEGNVINEEVMIKEFIERKDYKDELHDHKKKMKLMNALLRKGFQYEDIYRVLKEIE